MSLPIKASRGPVEQRIVSPVKESLDEPDERARVVVWVPFADVSVDRRSPTHLVLGLEQTSQGVDRVDQTELRLVASWHHPCFAIEEPRHFFDGHSELLDGGMGNGGQFGKRVGRTERIKVIGDFSHLHEVMNDLVTVFIRSGLDCGSCPVTKRMKFLHDWGRRDRLVERLVQNQVAKTDFHQ
jgi:hypothetical protein